MSTRSNILSALRNDFGTVQGIKESWKYVPQLETISETKFPFHYIGFGTAVNKPLGDMQDNWEVPVLCVVFFSIKTDPNNSGKVETEAERMISLYQEVVFSNTSAIDAVVSLDLITITPYINTGIENKGFLLLEYKLNYIGV